MKYSFKVGTHDKKNIGYYSKAIYKSSKLRILEIL